MKQHNLLPGANLVTSNHNQSLTALEEYEHEVEEEKAARKEP